jgi:deoxyribodipyrimidine photo-lyase
VSHYKVNKLYAKREVTFEEKQTEQLVQTELWKQQCEMLTFSTSTLYHAQDLPFSIKDIPDVFSNFRKKVEKESTIRSVFEKPISISSPEFPVAQFPTLDQLGLSFSEIDKRAAIVFEGGESAALKRMNHYFSETKAISQYKETRNGLIGADYSSKFSAWLSLGCLSPREIFFELKKYESQFGANESTYWLVFELLWRDYFRFMMKKYSNKFFQQSGIQNKGISVNKHNIQMLDSWINGTTGVDFVDANMLELKLTGFMSNRGRQNVASYLCNDLKLDWRYGAAYFEQQLIDYDVSSNWGNWAYLAGVGNDPRGNRYFNIDKQAQDYDRDKSYRKLWLQ